MVDEAHRTQYGALAARMRAGLPNACMLAFTGTPIDKKDRSTREVFGDYLHRYLIDQAVQGRRDGADLLRNARRAAAHRWAGPRAGYSRRVSGTVRGRD